MTAAAGVALAIGLAAAAGYLGLLRREPGALRSLVKTLAVGALAVGGALSGAPPLLVAALALGAAGDLALSRPGATAFLAGLGLFLAAHLLYVVLLLEGPRVPLEGARWSGVAAVVALSAVLGRQLFRAAGRLRWPVAAYVAVIGLMAVTALGSALPLAVAGALLFVASDAILGVETFLLPAAAPARRWTGPLLWMLYWAAQACLMAAFV